MPLTRRLPKRGFNNMKFAKDYAEINVCELNVFENGAVVTFEALVEKGLVKKTMDGVRILGKGELKSKLEVKAAGITASAKEKIEAAGGKAEVI
jgi:large subunit ribosomal protein L15